MDPSFGCICLRDYTSGKDREYGKRGSTGNIIKGCGSTDKGKTRQKMKGFPFGLPSCIAKILHLYPALQLHPNEK